MDASRCKDGVCEYRPSKNIKEQCSPIDSTSVTASRSRTSLYDRNGGEDFTDVKSALAPESEKRVPEPDDKDVYLENIIKKASSRKAQKKYHRASSDCDSSENEEESPHFHGSEATTLTREQALKLSLRKKIDERRQKR
jgi:hypothetical protein